MFPEMFTVNHAQQHTQSSWDHTKYPILSKMSLSNTALYYQPSELGAWIQNYPDRFAQIHKMTMLGLLWYNNIGSKTRLDYPKTRKGANTAGRKAIRCYLATFVTAGAPQVLQLKLKAMENLRLGGTVMAPMLNLDLLLQLSSNMQGSTQSLFVLSDLK